MTWLISIAPLWLATSCLYSRRKWKHVVHLYLQSLDQIRIQQMAARNRNTIKAINLKLSTLSLKELNFMYKKQELFNSSLSAFGHKLIKQPSYAVKVSDRTIITPKNHLNLKNHRLHLNSFMFPLSVFLLL